MTVLVRVVIAATTSAATASPSLAQHVVDSRLPTTWTDGLLSGLAHPVIGLDHLAFIVVVGLVAALSRDGVRIAALFAGAMLVGILMQVAKVRLPMLEVLVAGSVLLAGVVLVLRRLESELLWRMFAVGAGVVHGLALGAPIMGAASGPLVFYLLGTGLSVGLIIAPVRAFASLTLAEDRAEDLKVQAAGGAVIALGMFFVATAVVSATAQAG